jgi:hypothetical protein
MCGVRTTGHPRTFVEYTRLARLAPSCADWRKAVAMRGECWLRDRMTGPGKAAPRKQRPAAELAEKKKLGKQPPARARP